MKFAVLSIALLLSTGSAASALEFRSPVTQQLSACDSRNLTRVAQRGTDDTARLPHQIAQPGACCRDRLRCGQFLATRSVLKPQLDPRT